MRLVDLLQLIRAAFGGVHLLAAVRQSVEGQLAMLGIVIDDQQPAGIPWHRPSLQRTLLYAAVDFSSAKLGES